MPAKRRAATEDRDEVDDSITNVLLVRIDRIISGADKKGTASTIGSLIAQPTAVGLDGRPRGKRSEAEFVNARNAQGETLLSVAAYFFAAAGATKKARDIALAICELLLAKGAEPGLWETVSGLTPLARACTMAPDVKDTRLIAALLDHAEEIELMSDEEEEDEDDDNSSQKMNKKKKKKKLPAGKKGKQQQQAVAKEDDEICDDDPLAHHHSPPIPPAVDFPCCAAGLPPALLCAQAGNLHSLRYLVQQRGASPQATGAVARQSMVHMAALGGHLNCVEFAVFVLGFEQHPEQQQQQQQQDRKSSPTRNAKNNGDDDSSPSSPSSLAPSAASLDSVRCLRGGTALHYAAEQPDASRCSAVIDYLVTRHGCDVNARTLRGATPLLVATESNSSAAVGALLRHGADYDLAAQDRTKPIHVAIRFGYVRVMQLLVERGCVVPKLANPPRPKPAPKPRGKGGCGGGKPAAKASAKAKKAAAAAAKKSKKKKKKKKKGSSSDDEDSDSSTESDEVCSSSSSSASSSSSSSEEEDSDDPLVKRRKRLEKHRRARVAAAKRKPAAKAKKPQAKKKKKKDEDTSSSSDSSEEEDDDDVLLIDIQKRAG